MTNTISKTFRLGKTVITANANRILNTFDVAAAMNRHAVCDWGNVCEDDWRRNNAALRNGARLFSSYEDCRETKFWIITEADRSVTTVLLPEDY